MKIIKKIGIVSLSLLSFVAQAEMFSEEQYKTIESSFIEYAKENGDDVYPFYVDNYLDIKKEEMASFLKVKESNPPNEILDLIKAVSEGNANNSRQVINYSGNKTAWVMANNLKGNRFFENNCSYLKLISTDEDCLATPPVIKENIKQVLNYNDIYLNEEYFSDFFFIHELSHLIPQQRTFPENIDVTRIWVDNYKMQYREVYSDLFAVIYLHNILGYHKEELNNVVLFRNFNLNANDDLMHYSVPYIEAMLKNDEWETLTTFESIDNYIIKLYQKVNKDIVISKKNYRHIRLQNFEWCNNLNFSPFRVREVLDTVVYHCKKVKSK